MCTDSQDSLTSWISTYNIRPCWSDLGSFIPKSSTFNEMMITYIIYRLGGFLFGFLFILFGKPSPVKLIYLVMSIEVLVHGMMFILYIFEYFKLGSVLYSPDLRHTVHSQLKDSLPRYNEDGFLLREAWDNTMADGCCGVDGYQDFVNFNMPIPSVCQVEVSPSYAKVVSFASSKTFTSGCVDAVMLHIIRSEVRRVFAFLCLIVFHMFILPSIIVCPIRKFCLIKKSQSSLNDNQESM